MLETMLKPRVACFDTDDHRWITKTGVRESNIGEPRIRDDALVVEKEWPRSERDEFGIPRRCVPVGSRGFTLILASMG